MTPCSSLRWEILNYPLTSYYSPLLEEKLSMELFRFRGAFLGVGLPPLGLSVVFEARKDRQLFVS